MSKKKRKQRHFHLPADSPSAFRRNGLNAFRRSDFNTAIAQWSQLNVEDASVRKALAEAHFRRALIGKDAEACLVDLLRATELMPGESRYWYHRGLAHHRADQLGEALQAYARAAENGFSREGFGFVRGLAEVERDPHVQLDTLDWLSQIERVPLLPIAALLRGEPHAVLDVTPVLMLWRGLALIATGQPDQALNALAVSGQALRGGAEGARAYYHGLALNALGKHSEAFDEWVKAIDRTPTPRLQAAVSQTHMGQLRAALNTGDWHAALNSIQAALKAAPDQPALQRIELVARNRLAHELAARGDWNSALPHWQCMRTILEADPHDGSITPILHNLAITYERLEQWEAAAEQWRVLLNKLPRRATKKPQNALHLSLPVAEVRTWLRKHMLECYKRAGRPDQAITHYRNLVKANPDDLDLRLELTGALLANEQVIAARNELERILKKDPAQLDARVRLAEVHLSRGEFYAAEQHLRAALQTDPNHASARRGLVDLLCQHGHDRFSVADFESAKKLYEEALQLSPDDEQVLVWLGNTELQMRRLGDARKHFAEAITKGDLHTYVHIFGCWAQNNNLDEAQRILDQAESAGVASAHLYIDIAGECFQAAQREQTPTNFFASRPSKRPAENKWERLGRAMLQKAESSGDNPEELRHIVAVLGPLRPDLALEYAQKLVHHTPKDPVILLQIGVLHSMTDNMRAAKDHLRKAASLARKQGNIELLEEIEEVRRMISNPLSALMSEMELSLDDEDLF